MRNTAPARRDASKYGIQKDLAFSVERLADDLKSQIVTSSFGGYSILDGGTANKHE